MIPILFALLFLGALLAFIQAGVAFFRLIKKHHRAIGHSVVAAFAALAGAVGRVLRLER